METISFGRTKKVWIGLLVCVIFLLTAVSTTQAAPTEHHDGVYHTVRYGEYLSIIAQHYGVSVHDILAANPQIKNPNWIYAGMVLFIPTGYSHPPAPPPPPPHPPHGCSSYHYVSYGETLSSIAYWYGRSIHSIAQANNIYNWNHIYAGMYLCIP